MKKEAAFGNKLVRKKDYDRSMQYHLQSIRNAKPITRATEYGDFSINNRKKQFQNQEKFTQIERQNRILLEKITSIMNKTKKGSFTDRTNKSLNSTFRKKQMQNIQIENAKFLKRLQQKKSNYETQKLNKDWQKQKNTLKIMSNFPFMLSDRPKQRRISLTQMEKKSYSQEPFELVRVRVINGFSFLVTINLSLKKLRIVGDCKDRKQIKVIQIQRNQALQFIQEECHGKLQLIFEHLRYDKQEGVLYLIGNDVDLDQLIVKESKATNNNINEENEEEKYDQQIQAAKVKYSKQSQDKKNQNNFLNSQQQHGDILKY